MLELGKASNAIACVRVHGYAIVTWPSILLVFTLGVLSMLCVLLIYEPCTLYDKYIDLHKLPSSPHRLPQLLLDNYKRDITHLYPMDLTTETVFSHASTSASIASHRPYRAAIVYLTQTSAERMHKLCTSLMLADRAFNALFRYPIFIYIDKDATEEAKQQIANCTVAPVVFVLLELVVEFPAPPLTEESARFAAFVSSAVDLKSLDWQNVAPTTEGPIDTARPGPGYRAMIRFFFSGIQRHWSTKHLDYYMRLDTDSYITSPIPYDPFFFMHLRGIRYAYRVVDEDYGIIVNGASVAMARIARDYNLHDQHCVPSSYSVLPFDGQGPFAGSILDAIQLAIESNSEVERMPVIFNNFEMVHAPSFREPRMDVLLDTVERLGGITRYRWGDALLRYFQLTFFFAPAQVWKFCDWDYVHFRSFARSCLSTHSPVGNSDDSTSIPFLASLQMNFLAEWLLKVRLLLLVHSAGVQKVYYALLDFAHFWIPCVLIPTVLWKKLGRSLVP